MIEDARERVAPRGGDAGRRRTPARSYRFAGACLFLGACGLLAAAIAEEEPGLLVAALLQLAGWLALVGRANRLEARAREAE